MENSTAPKTSRVDQKNNFISIKGTLESDYDDHQHAKSSSFRLATEVDNSSKSKYNNYTAVHFGPSDSGSRTISNSTLAGSEIKKVNDNITLTVSKVQRFHQPPTVS